MDKIISLSIIFYLFLNVDTKIITESSEHKNELGYKYYPEIGWVHHHPMPLNWDDARLFCYYEEAELMSPCDEQMLKVMSKIGGSSPIWTGVHATYYKGNFFSISGIPLSNMPITWAQDEPDNENNSEECLIMLPGGNMADCNCIPLSNMPITWAQDEPDNENNSEECLIMLPGGNMADCNCNETYAFSCYKPNNFQTFDCGSISGYKLDHRTKSCYKFHSNFKNWSTAFMICAREGAQLAIIDTPGEQEVLRDLFVKKGSNAEFMFLGFRDWNNIRLWMTINGKNINNLPGLWTKGEPNNYGGNEHCGTMTKEGTLNDGNCKGRLPFICEFKKKF